MGLLDDVLQKTVPDGNVAKPLMIALGTLLVSRMMSGGGSAAGSAGQSEAAPPLQPSSTPAGGAADGGLLGGLSGLLDKLQNAGHGDKVNSWVGSGENKPIDPGQLGAALGQQNVSQAAQQAGINEQQLLSQLAAALPGIVDKLTANGRIPSLQELTAALTQK